VEHSGGKVVQLFLIEVRETAETNTVDFQDNVIVLTGETLMSVVASEDTVRGPSSASKAV
jgi:hypothetical protein